LVRAYTPPLGGGEERRCSTLPSASFPAPGDNPTLTQHHEGEKLKIFWRLFPPPPALERLQTLPCATVTTTNRIISTATSLRPPPDVDL